ncbi:methionyl-tRNA formyltransferase [uncultured Alistipes sp.]|jgi:methionyl-tRNA formyltransferase|uniref:methionyl-tRNA formyltransferase n=1 Tax=uncultured Alistipes sp. TaxID=538949 RepID=UPI0025D51786|nr:methionyl-tRNA formyltransferase [uncultured Alistipes sp.]
MNPKELRIVFMGTPEFAVPSLRALVKEGYNVVGVVTSPDKPAGRGQKIHQSDVKLAATELGLQVLQPEKLKAPEFVEAMQALQPDLGIVIAFRMLPEVIWAMPRLGTFNLHASLLPQYRGAAPINWAIINGDTQTGVTTFLLNHEIDKGAIIGQVQVSILPEDNAGTLYEKLMNTGTPLVTKTVDRIATGQIAPLEQADIDESQLRPAPKIFKEDCLIDWSWDGRRIVNFIRGLSPYPAAWTGMQKADGGEPLTAKIYSATFESATDDTDQTGASISHAKPGDIESDGRTFIRVACTGGWITLGELQIAGKKRLPVRDLLLGLRDISQYRFE